jgi:hypothetical protein
MLFHKGPSAVTLQKESALKLKGNKGLSAEKPFRSLQAPRG